ADSADDGRADRGGSDDRMRLASERRDGPFQFVQGGAGEAQDLPSLIDQVDPADAERVDDDDTAVVRAERGRAAVEAGSVARHDDDAAGLDRGFEGLPLLDRGAGPDDGHHRAFAVAVAPSVAGGAARAGQDVAGPDDVAQAVEQGGMGGHDSLR